MSYTILYIEDNPLNMRLVRRILGKTDFRLLEALDGQSGLALIKSEMPDLVLVDVNLPDINGLIIVAQVKNDARLHHIPFIAVTANAMSGDRAHCLNAGCDGYVAKPIARQELMNAINHCVAASTSGAI